VPDRIPGVDAVGEVGQAATEGGQEGGQQLLAVRPVRHAISLRGDGCAAQWRWRRTSLRYRHA
jgi:hypothetical protein